MRIGNPFDNRREHIVVCEPVKRVVRPRLSRLIGENATAVTIGDDTYYMASADNPAVRAHEDAHELQRKRFVSKYKSNTLGTLMFWAAYGWAHLTHGYRANPYEVEARAAEDKALDDGVD